MQTRWKSDADVAKLQDLRRMQAIALALLLTMAALLAVTTVTIAAHPWTAWLKAFAEAAVVGAVADWFAVVALFRHPLGLPIAHTAIIPNNKDRIGESLGRFVEENFLTPENVMQRLARVNIAKECGTWLAEPANSDRAADGICAMVPRVLTMIDDEDVARFLTRTLLGELEKVNLSPVAGEVLELVTSGEHYQALFDDALKGIERLITANQALILEKFGEASKYTPGFIDQYIVDRFVAGIVRLLQEVIADPRHPLRNAVRRFDTQAHRRAEDIAGNARARRGDQAPPHRASAHQAVLRGDLERHQEPDPRRRLVRSIPAARNRVVTPKRAGLRPREGRRDAAQAQRVAAWSAWRR